MNWEAIGAVGETVGALAVLITLIILVVQIRHSVRAMDESNRLERAAAIDRHSDTIGRWRGRLTEHEELTSIWMAGRADEELDTVSAIRLNNLWIDFANIQRANYIRANIVDEPGLSMQATISVAAEASQSNCFAREWQMFKVWAELASPEFASAVETEIAKFKRGENLAYRVISGRSDGGSL